MIVAVVAIVALGVGLAAPFGASSDEDGEDGEDSPDPAASPAAPAALPQTTDSTPPSLTPVSSSPDPADDSLVQQPRPCFVDKEELQAAVDDYTAGGAACRENNSECGVIQTYGWPIGSWCTSNITDMSWLFRRKDSFNDDLSSWDTSKVTDMMGTFNDASSFNGDVSNWDTSGVTSMVFMFRGASSFNGGVSDWDTSKVTTMAWMFNDASSFNRGVSNWDTSSVTSMWYMFEGASSFSQNLCVWGAHYSTDKYGDMFYGTNCPNQDDPAGPDTNWCAATCDSA